ncbi:hypothetical protein [Thermoanaerobacter thermocopriae]|nr:hypothetical protein [Thermoanaerobacter thermocopriae]
MKENMVHDLSNIENILNVLPDLADEKIFALLVILTTDEKLF